MGAVRDVPLFHSLDAFLAWEDAQELRHELVDGVVDLMADGTEGHDAISMNIGRALGNALLDKPCRVHGPNLKLLSRARTAAMYPDAFVRCGPRDPKRIAVDDAVIVFEVLSEGTAKKDMLRKRRAYEAIPTLRRIVYVDPDEPVLAVFVREADGRWREDEIIGLDAELPLPEIDAVLPMAEIYRGVDVPEQPAPLGDPG